MGRNPFHKPEIPANKNKKHNQKEKPWQGFEKHAKHKGYQPVKRPSK